jgi:hypothetical protein
MEHAGDNQSDSVRFERPHGGPQLTPELADFLRTQGYACLTHPTDIGTVFVLKAPRLDIDSARGRVPLAVHHALYSHPRAPVIRTLLRLYDHPAQPLAFESFVNVRDPDQLADYRDLAGRDLLRLLFYDEQLEHRLSKSVHNRAGGEMGRLLAVAVRLSLGIPADWYDFDLAKAEVQRRAPL